MQFTSIFSDLAAPVPGKSVLGGEMADTTPADAGTRFADALSQLGGRRALVDPVITEPSTLQAPQTLPDAETAGTDDPSPEMESLPVFVSGEGAPSELTVAITADAGEQSSAPRGNATPERLMLGSPASPVTASVQPQGGSAQRDASPVQTNEGGVAPLTPPRRDPAQNPTAAQVQSLVLAPADGSRVAIGDPVAQVAQEARSEIAGKRSMAVAMDSTPETPPTVSSPEPDPSPPATVVVGSPSRLPARLTPSAQAEAGQLAVSLRSTSPVVSQAGSAVVVAVPETQRAAAVVPDTPAPLKANAQIAAPANGAPRPDADTAVLALSFSGRERSDASTDLPMGQSAVWKGAAVSDLLVAPARNAKPVADLADLGSKVSVTQTTPADGRPSVQITALPSTGQVASTAGPPDAWVASQPPDRAATPPQAPAPTPVQISAPQAATTPAPSGQTNISVPIVAPVQTALAEQVAKGRASDPGALPTDALRADLALPGEGPSRTAPSLPAAPQLASPEAARAISLQVIDALRQGSGTIDVTLMPEELGRLRLSIGVSEGAMLVTLSAERPETLDLMRRHIDILQAEARAEGFADLEFAFSGDGPSQDQSRPGAATLTAQLNTETRPSPPAQGPQAGLDLRL